MENGQRTTHLRFVWKTTGYELREREGDAPTRGIETRLGNPAATPMLCAALEIHEAIKVLLGLGAPLRVRLLTIDALHGEATTLILV